MQKLLGTRLGTSALGILVALVAGGAVLIYVSQYRQSVHESSRPVSVLVAKQLIPKGTTGNIIASQELFQWSSVPKGTVKQGAITDPAVLTGRIATDAIYPGQQLTDSLFSAKPSDALQYRFTEYDRAVSVPLDSAHGLLGFVQTGDRVDIEAGFNWQPPDGKTIPILKTIAQNVLVLDSPAQSATSFGSSSTNTTKNVVLQLTDQQAANLAFASDNGKVWLVLRGEHGALQHTPTLVTLDTVLFGAKPIALTIAIERAEQAAIRNLNRQGGS